MDALQLALHCFSLLFHFLALHKDLVELLLKSFVIVLNVVIGIFDILRASIGAQLIQSQVVVSQLPLQLTHLVVEFFLPGFEFVVQLLLLTDLLAFVLESPRLLLDALSSIEFTIIFSFVLVT